jgi:cardiolipin synthase
MGEPIPEEERWSATDPERGAIDVRIVAGEPATGGMFRVDQLVAALARKRLWLTDAYYAGTTAYVQGLKSAAASGVDVRLLVPGGSDIPLVKLVSRAGYRPLLEAGVRVFEWNGTMLHAKTAVADGRWARVGSTNLNLASWLGNCELDAVIEDEAFAHEMEEMYLADLGNATEIVLDERHKLRAPPRTRPLVLTSGGGSSGRAAAGAMRITNTLGAAFTNRRVLEPVEARTTVLGGIGLLILAVLFAVFPSLLAYPLVALFVWIALALLYRGYKLHRAGKGPRPGPKS